MDMVLAKSDISIAERYSQLVKDEALRNAIFPRLKAEWQASVDALLAIMGQAELLAGNPVLKRSIRNRFPTLDSLNHLQIELLQRHRSGESDERVRRAIHLTINGATAGLRNSGRLVMSLSKHPLRPGACSLLSRFFRVALSPVSRRKV